ncbi:MAG: Lrp/AsnC ligand binding domain-containing protein [Actinobacteria bacterium]|nr:Lrp/AsnC ligand binding domain-containing protein [Actinomycetota bacterium]
MDAYILIHAQMGTAAEIARAVRGMKDVLAVDAVTGPYDVIVRAQADSQHGLDAMVLSRIQALPGVYRTLTCPIWGRARPHHLPVAAGGWGS